MGALKNKGGGMTVLSDIYNAFEPVPLEAGSPMYVNCKDVRGGGDVLVELGKPILMSDRPTCQLYTGHRGGGKSTELLRLKQDLEQKGCTVVYFSAEDADVNPEDVEYTDILLACTRHLLEGVRAADPTPVVSWLRDRVKALEDIMKMDISLGDPKAEVSIHQFAKITASIRTQPTQRARLRDELSPHTENLVAALNTFIADAQKKLPPDRNRLVLIADGLEKVTLITRDQGRTNHDEIFIDRSEQLRGLNCHVIYTVPISLALSSRASDLMEIYNCHPKVLPMVMVRSQNQQVYGAGLETMKQIVRSRIKSIPKIKDMSLDPEVFESAEVLEQLCLISGGHVRNLMLLMRTTVQYQDTEKLPITADDLRQGIRQLRVTYRTTVNDGQWSLLAYVYRCKCILNDDAYRSLLFNRCLLEYRDENTDVWHDVHPLLLDVPEFKAALAKLESS
jgi:AAA ATPase domain